MEDIKIAIAEKHEILRAALVEAFTLDNQIDVVFDSNGSIDLMDKLSRIKADVLLLSSSLVGYEGVDALKLIRESGELSEMKIVMFSNYKDRQSLINFAKLGANTSIEKFVDLEVLNECILEVYSNGFFFNKHFTLEILESALKAD